MAARDLFDQLGSPQPDTQDAASEAAPEAAPLGGTRAEAVQRLQVGLTGLCAMVLIVGVASVIGTQADKAEQAAVPDAAPTTEPTAAPPQRDPLADAGVVPDIPTQLETEAIEPILDDIVTDADGAVTVPDTAPTEPEEFIDEE